MSEYIHFLSNIHFILEYCPQKIHAFIKLYFPLINVLVLVGDAEFLERPVTFTFFILHFSKLSSPAGRAIRCIFASLRFAKDAAAIPNSMSER